MKEYFKKIDYKKIMFCLIVAILATNCGGGGGGGSNSATMPTVIPAIPIESRTVSVTQNKPVTKVALLDHDFITNQNTLMQDYSRIAFMQLVDSGPSGKLHGEEVLDVLTNKEKDRFHILAITIGEDITQEITNLEGKKDKMCLLRPRDAYYIAAFKDWFKNQKVKVFNQSWGAPANSIITKNDLAILDYEYDPKPTDTQAEKDKKHKEAMEQAEQTIDLYKQMVNGIEKVEGRAIFVWSNGNHGKKLENGVYKEVKLDYGSVHAQLPKRYSELEKGWLSAIGIDPNGKKHYSDHLAYAKGTQNWAIAANGNDFSGNYGSSYAAPRVTRAAALVGAKFDWMTNSQVRQTLLTTTDKPEEENDIRNIILESDEKYGWGVLNEERALKGPGSFLKILLKTEGDNVTKFAANLPKDRTSTFENNIYGNGGLTKLGEGKLILNGESHYTAATEIKEGTLEINKYHRSNVKVEEKGTLILNNRVILESNLSNAGKITLFGKTTVKGDFTASKDSVIQFNSNSSLEVMGTTKLNENKLEISSEEYLSAVPQRKELIKANKIEGSIPEVISKGSKKAKIQKIKNSIIVEMSRKNIVDYVAADATSSNLNVAENIENMLEVMDAKVEKGSATPEELAKFSAIEELSAKQMNDKAEKLSGEIYASAQNMTFKQASSVNRNLSNHLGELKSFRNSDYKWQGWTSGILSAGEINKSGYAKADTKLQGGAFGIDKKIDSTTQIGVGIDYSYAKAEFNKYAGKFSSDEVGISLYTKKYLANDYYLLGRIGMSKYSTRVSREVLDEKLNSVNNGDIKHHDKMLSTYVEAGKHHKYFTSFMGYSQDNLRRGSFDEKEEWGIVANSKIYTKNAVILGIRSKYKIDNYILNGHLTHEINVGNRSLDFEGRFAGSTTNLKFKGINQSKTTTWVGIGLTKELTKQITTNLNLDMKFDDKNKSESMVGVTFAYKF